MRVEEHTIELASSPVFLRRAPASEPTPLYLHGVPASADVWTELLALTGGVAPDLPGFGRTGKGGQLDLTIGGHAAFLKALLDDLGVDRVQLVLHGWGAGGGLLFAQQHPQQVERLVLINALPLAGAHDWPRLARMWRTPLLGELVMGAITRRLLTRLLRSGCADPAAWPEEKAHELWEQFDQGTQRAILRLHRAAGREQLRAVADKLPGLRQPALVLWGELDPWWPLAQGEQLAEQLPGAELVAVREAGHWPWLESPEAVNRIVSFLGRS